jgi:hypothetical protein
VQAATDDILQVKVSIVGARPPIWRRLEVPASMPLSDLHHLLQVAFGWEDVHDHCFESRGTDESADARGIRTVEGALLRRKRLVDLVSTQGDQAVYRYDLVDDWEHLIEVEARHAPEPGQHYPICTAGRRAGPPEDCGGIVVLDDLLGALVAPDDPDNRDLLALAPPGYDPTRFDREALNDDLRRMN